METISFARGIPAPECLPVAELADCARAAIERDGRTILNYGPAAATGRCGSGSPSATASTAAACCSQTARSRASTSSPSARAARGAGAGRGADLRPAAEARWPSSAPRSRRSRWTRTGLDVDALESELARPPAGVVPLHDPDLPEPERADALDSSGAAASSISPREHGLTVVEDDPYGHVRFEGEPPPTLLELAGGDGIVYGSSFSKTIAPGARVGYLVLPDGARRPSTAAATATYITPSLLGAGDRVRVLRRGLSSRTSTRVRAAAARAARRDARRARARARRAARVEPARGRLLRLARAADGRRRRSSCSRAPRRSASRSCPAPTFGGPPSCLRLAFSFVDVGRDRRGHRPARLASSGGGAGTAGSVARRPRRPSTRLSRIVQIRDVAAVADDEVDVDSSSFLTANANR